MKISFKQIFCILLLLVCLLPLAVFVIAGPSAPGANERLAAKPRLTAGGRLNFDVLSDTADYFDSHFGLRQALITANAAADAAVFGESATPEVLLGTDGWLYYADTLADYTGSDSMTARQLWCAAQNLALMQEYAQTQGAAFLFVCAPNKNTVYPAQMPARYTRAEGPSDLDRLETLLDAQDVAFCDVRQTLLDAQELTYYRTDSHWNGYGSALACDAILAALGRESSLAGEPFTLQPHTGDLYQMLYPASGKQEQGLSLARAREFQYVGTVRGADDQLIRTQSDGSGALLAFRDSFGNALHADLAEAFQTAVFSRAMPYDLSLMQDARPNAVLVELVERNLRWLRQLVDDMEEQGVEDCFLIQLGPDLTDLTRHQEIMDAQLQICEENEDIVLVSTLPAELTGADMKDEGGIHFTQKALNLIGEDAGKNAGEYVKEHGAEKESQ